MHSDHAAGMLPPWFRELTDEEKRAKIKILRREDNDLLYFIAMDDETKPALRRLAAMGLQNQELLCRLAKLCPDAGAREAAAHRIFLNILPDIAPHEEE